MPTTTYSDELTITTCWCGIKLAIPENLYRQAREHGQKVHCPLGHVFVFTETELDREREKREAAEGRASRAEARRQAERDLREHVERQLAAQKDRAVLDGLGERLESAMDRVDATAAALFNRWGIS